MEKLLNKEFRERTEIKPRTPLYLVLPKLQEEAEKQGANISLVIDALRAGWIKSLPSKINLSSREQDKIVTKEELIHACKSLGVDIPKSDKKLLRLAERYGVTVDKWRNDDNFVFKYRLHLPIGGIYQPSLAPSYDLFFKLFGKMYKGKKKDILKILANFDLSIRPLNLCSSITNSEAIRNFLPTLDQKFQKDPFGIQRKEHLVLDKIGDKFVYLATRKKEHGTYLAVLNIVAYCTAGCARCYRGEQTRELKRFAIINPDGSEDVAYFLSPVEQMRRLVKKWNKEKNPPEDILLSGGEPLDVNVEDLIKIIEILKKAKYLKFFRICTGDIFLGQPFRVINPRFLEALKEFHEETGKSVKFACNLAHPKLITPEAVYAIKNLQKLGIGVEIQTQTPLEENVLCFQRDVEQKIKKLNKKKLTDEEIIEAWAPSLAKSFKLLKDLCIKVAMVSDRPYKFIHDMQQSVSVIYNLVLYSLLSEPHVGVTDAAIRPTSFAVFTPNLPNLNLSFYSLEYFAKVKDAYKMKQNKIIIRLPHAVGEMAEYEEPYWKGINDLEMVQKFADIKFWKKLRERVKELTKKIK